MKKLYSYKKKLLYTTIAMSALLLESCGQNRQNSICGISATALDTLTGRPHCGGIHTRIHSGKGSLLGIVSVSNDHAHLRISFIMEKGWALNESNLYVGLLSDFPAYQTGEQKTDLFRYKVNHKTAVNDYTYHIPLKDIKEQQGCIAISAYSIATFYDASDKILVKEEGRCDGKNLANSGAFPTYIKYCICSQPSTSGN